MSASVENPLSFIAVEEWADRDALDRHFAQPHLHEFAAGLLEVVSERPEVAIHEVAETGESMPVEVDASTDSMLSRYFRDMATHQVMGPDEELSAAQGVELMGDLPFVVATDSADVWGRRDSFRPDLRVGTPPDAFSAEGQQGPGVGPTGRVLLGVLVEQLAQVVIAQHQIGL